jgi:hypothetical protein
VDFVWSLRRIHHSLPHAGGVIPHLIRNGIGAPPITARATFARARPSNPTGTLEETLSARAA